MGTIDPTGPSPINPTQPLTPATGADTSPQVEGKTVDTKEVSDKAAAQDTSTTINLLATPQQQAKVIFDEWVDTLKLESWKGELISAMWDKFNSTIAEVDKQRVTDNFSKLVAMGALKYGLNVSVGQAAGMAIGGLIRQAAMQEVVNMTTLAVLMSGNNYVNQFNAGPQVAETFAAFAAMQLSSTVFTAKLYAYADERAKELYPDVPEEELIKDEVLQQEIRDTATRWVESTRASIAFTALGVLHKTDYERVEGGEHGAIAMITGDASLSESRAILAGELLSSVSTLKMLYSDEQIDRYFNEWADEVNHAFSVEGLIGQPMAFINMINSADYHPDSSESRFGVI